MISEPRKPWWKVLFDSCPLLPLNLVAGFRWMQTQSKQISFSKYFSHRIMWYLATLISTIHPGPTETYIRTSTCSKEKRFEQWMDQRREHWPQTLALKEFIKIWGVYSQKVQSQMCKNRTRVWRQKVHPIYAALHAMVFVSWVQKRVEIKRAMATLQIHLISRTNESKWDWSGWHRKRNHVFE